MSLPTPTGTILYYSTNGTDWTAFGCVTNISYKESTKTSEVDLINNDTSQWSGTTVTSRTRSFEVSGLFKNTGPNGGVISGSTLTGTNNTVPSSGMSGAEGVFKVGQKYRLALALPVTDTNYTVIRFTRDDGEVATGNELRFVVTDRNITFSGTEPVSFTITFAIDAGSLC